MIPILLFFTIDETVTMFKEEKKEADLPNLTDLGKDAFYKSLKFRSERNFYLVSFTFTILIILLRVESLIRKLRELQKSEKIK